MANKVWLKRSAVEGKIPLTTDLDLGALAINTYDGKLFLKRNNGLQDFIVEVGGNRGFYVKNQTGSTITKGSIVKFAGTLGSSGKLLIAPFLANGSSPSEYVVGVMLDDIADGSDGFAVDHGKIYNYNTSGWVDSTVLYASATVPGGFTPTRPEAPNNKVTCAAVIHSHASAGVLQVRISLGSQLGNDELVELSSLVSNQTLIFNSTTGRFENMSLKTVNGNSLIGSGDIVISGGGGGASVTVSDTAPSSPVADSLWWDSSVGQLRIYYNDGDTSQWVDAVNTQGLPGIDGTNGTNGIDGIDGVDGLGVPAGGTTRQVLSKVSNADNDTAWTTISASNFASQTANTVLAAPNNAAGVPTFRNLTLEDLPDAWVKRSVRVATTANITLSGTQTIDGVSLAVGDRVLVKNQSTVANNGIYVVASSTWSRANDANTSSELAGALVAVDTGSVNGGKSYDSDFKSTDTLGTTALTWSRILDDTSLALYYRKNTSTTLTSGTGAQSWLGLSSGVVVAASTIYEFEGSFRLSTTGTTSHTESTLFGSSATVSNIDYCVNRFINSTTATAPHTMRTAVISATAVTGSITTTQDVSYYIRGTVAFSTGGNFNPQIQFSAAPGGTSIVLLGAHFKMTAIGTTGSNASNGTWA